MRELRSASSAILALLEERRYLRERMDAAEQTLIEERAEAEESHEAFELLSSECTEIEARAAHLEECNDSAATTISALKSRLGKAVEALVDTLDFVERHSNRWDGVNGKHPHAVVTAARSVLSDLGAKDD